MSDFGTRTKTFYFARERSKKGRPTGVTKDVENVECKYIQYKQLLATSTVGDVLCRVDS